MNSTKNAVRNTLLITALVCPTFIPIAGAADGKQPGPLPGVDAKAGEGVVDKTASIVTQEPVPDSGPGWVRVGDWDVKVSGSVSVDISAGSTRAR